MTHSEIRSLLENTTEGEWKQALPNKKGIEDESGELVALTNLANPESYANAAFIAASKSIVRQLLEENDKLRHCVQDTFWMARRYANGRHTTIPSHVREWYRMLKRDFPDIKIAKDDTITMDEYRAHKGGFDLDSDWLIDCND